MNRTNHCTTTGNLLGSWSSCSLAEWLRRWTRIPLGYPSASSNPANSLLAEIPRRSACDFFLAPSKHFLSLPASDKQAVGHIWSYKSVVPCGRTVVSSMHCGCSNPGSNLGQGSILLSGSRNMTLLFATSSYSWILCLKLTGVLCCLPAAKTAGRLQTEVLAQNHGKCPRATYFMPKLSWLQEGSTGLQ